MNTNSSGGGRPRRGSGVLGNPTLTEHYEELREGLVALAYRVTGDRDAAEDVVQEVFVALLKRTGNGANIHMGPGYLKAAVRRSALKWHRDRAKRREPMWCAALRQEASVPPTPPEVLRIKRLRELLDRVQSRLSSNQEKVFRLVHRRGLSYAAAAEQMGATEEGVRKQIYRARQVLRGHLASRGLESMDGV